MFVCVNVITVSDNRTHRLHCRFQFSRWSLLTVGVFYGIYHHNRLSKKEAAWREIEAKKQVVRDAQLVIEKKRAYEGLFWICFTSWIYSSNHIKNAIKFQISPFQLNWRQSKICRSPHRKRHKHTHTPLHMIHFFAEINNFVVNSKMQCSVNGK